MVPEPYDAPIREISSAMAWNWLWPIRCPWHGIMRHVYDGASDVFMNFLCAYLVGFLKRWGAQRRSGICYRNILSHR